jgi:hypothetical protein
MKITRLRLTIEPWQARDTLKDLRVEVIVDGTVYTATTPFVDDDFESRFDYLMEESRQEILMSNTNEPNPKIVSQTEGGRLDGSHR